MALRLAGREKYFIIRYAPLGPDLNHLNKIFSAIFCFSIAAISIKLALNSDLLRTGHFGAFRKVACLFLTHPQFIYASSFSAPANSGRPIRERKLANL